MSDPTAEWIALPVPRERDRLVQSGALAYAPIPFFAVEAALLPGKDSGVPLWASLLGGLAAVVVILGGLALIIRRQWSASAIHRDGAELRFLGRTSTAAGITEIRLSRVVRASGNTYFIQLHGRGTGRPTVLLASEGRPVLDDAARAALARFLASTHAVIPRDRWDPHGHMSRVANPGRLLAEDAVAVVEDPARADGFLPTLPSRYRSSSPKPVRGASDSGARDEGSIPDP